MTAIRGLIVGTSCSLVLITEDRRRRINNARNAVQNAQRLKSARNYRTGGGELALALEEEALLEPGLVHWVPPRGAKEFSNHTENWARRTELEFAKSSAERHRVEASRSERSAAVRADDNGNRRKSSPLAVDPSPTLPTGYNPFLQSQPTDSLQAALKANQMAYGAKATNVFAFPKTEEIIDVVQESTTSKHPRRLDLAIHLVHEALVVAKTPLDPDTPLIQAAALLTRTCQDLGRLDDAGRILRLIVAHGPLGEEEYYNFNPLELVEGLISELDSASTEQAVTADKLDLASVLFLPTFTEKPRLAIPRAFDIGRRLLELSFAANKLQHVDGLYWRCLVHRQDDYDFTGWFLTRLHEQNEHKSAIKYFLLCYSKMSPSQESLYAVGDVLVESVAAARNLKAGQVLKALEELCSGTCMLKTAWVMRLLSSHWQRHNDFEATEQIFRALRASGLRNIVAHPDGIYRVMMEIAFKADRPQIAESYFDEIVSEKPGLASDIRLLGLFAQHKARLGDWDGARMSFEAMSVSGKEASDAYGEVFVPILKIYARGHTTTETEDFLRFYVDELKVPIVAYTVTLMANHYGAVRDVQSLVQWLKYCADSGFKVDAAFSNAILTNCRRRWKLPFSDLRTMFLKLRAMSPEFADKCTEDMMVHAALSDPKCGSRSAVGRVVSLKIDPGKLAIRGKCAPEREVVLAMRQQLSFGRPGQSLRIYKRALHQGMPFSSHALRLAVQASLRVRENNYEAAYSLIQRAQRSGEDVSGAAVPLLAAQIRHINLSLAKEDRVDAIRKLMGQLGDKEIRVSDVTLNLAALSCLNAGRYAEAVEYALAAARALDQSGPCYNMYNFSILISSYAEMGDLERLRWAISRARLSDYWTELHCLRALKRARKRLDPPGGNCRVESDVASREVITKAIGEAVGARKKLRKERHIMQEEMIEIMKKAATDASPADFADASLLGMQPRIRGLDLEFDGLGFEGMGLEEDMGGLDHVGLGKVPEPRHLPVESLAG